MRLRVALPTQVQIGTGHAAAQRFHLEIQKLGGAEAVALELRLQACVSHTPAGKVQDRTAVIGAFTPKPHPRPDH
jgi:hypothetical protein